MSVLTYKSENVIVMSAAARITGLGPETFLKITRNEDAVKTVVGNDGRVTRSISANQSATVEITVMHGSLGSLFLAAQWLADRAGGAGLFPLSIVDPASGGTHVAPECWVKKAADVELGAQPGHETWVLECANLVSIFAPTAVVRAATP